MPRILVLPGRLEEHFLADLILRNGRIVNVFSAEVHSGDIAVWGGRIVGIGEYEGKKEIDLEKRYVLPGLIDGHMHIESSMVQVQEFARTVVPLGTTSVVCDPHEIANVHGLEGIHYILNSSKYSPVNIFVMLPSCVPATPFETRGSILRGFDLYPLLGEKWVLPWGYRRPGIRDESPRRLCAEVAEALRVFGLPRVAEWARTRRQ